MSRAPDYDDFDYDAEIPLNFAAGTMTWLRICVTLMCQYCWDIIMGAYILGHWLFVGPPPKSDRIS